MNDHLLTQYMSHFAGYGNLDGDYWMIGMEEGGGDTIEDVERRVAILACSIADVSATCSSGVASNQRAMWRWGTSKTWPGLRG